MKNVYGKRTKSKAKTSAKAERRFPGLWFHSRQSRVDLSASAHDNDTCEMLSPFKKILHQIRSELKYRITNNNMDRGEGKGRSKRKGKQHTITTISLKTPSWTFTRIRAKLGKEISTQRFYSRRCPYSLSNSLKKGRKRVLKEYLHIDKLLLI